MPDLVRIDIDALEKAVGAVLRRFPQVAGAYLFGSALGLCRPDSDIDIGLVLEDGAGKALRNILLIESAITNCLPRFDGHSLDVNVLDPDSILFAFKVIHEGRLIYIRDEERIWDVVEYVSRRYPERYFRYQQALKEIMDEVIGNAG